MTNFLTLEMSTGKLFQYSKDEKPGFVEHVVDKDGTITKSYRKYFEEGILGRLKSLHTIEKRMGDKGNVQQVRIVLQDEKEDSYVIDFPLKNQKGGLNDYSVSVARYMPALEENKDYLCLPYAIENTDDKGKVRKNYGISFYRAKLSSMAVDKTNRLPVLSVEKKRKTETGDVEVIPGDIPAVEWEQGIGDKMQINSQKRDLYLWNEVFKKHKINADFRLSKSSYAQFDSTKEDDSKPEDKPKTTARATATPTQTRKSAIENARPSEDLPKTNVSTASTIEDDDDDLPF